MIITIGFAAITLSKWALWKHVKERLETQRDFSCGKVNGCEIRMTELEYLFDRKEDYDNQVDLLGSYTRRLHCGLISVGVGFVEELEPDTMHRVNYDMTSETNAAFYLARRSLEGLRSTRGQYIVDTLSC